MSETLLYSEAATDRQDTDIKPDSLSGVLDIVYENKQYRLVNSRDCLISSIKIQTKSQKDLLAAVPYAMEEKLAASVDELHFAIGDELENKERPIIIVAHTKMKQWLENSPVNIDSMIPAVLALPSNETDWLIAIDDDRVLIRSGEYEGFECDVSQLKTQLSLHIKEKEKPASIDLCLHDDAEIPEFEESMRKLIKVHRYNTSFDEWLRTMARPLSNLNLLSGQYDRKANNAGSMKPWLPAMTLIILAFVIHLGASWYKLTSLESETSKLNENARQLFSDAFPDTKRIVNLRVQAQQKLKLMTSQLGKTDNGFFSLFMESMSVVKAFPAMRIIGFNWKQDYLQLQLSAATVTEVEQLEKSLSNKKYDVEIINAVNKEGRFRAQLMIRKLVQ